jgi:hypothetical protein
VPSGASDVEVPANTTEALYMGVEDVVIIRISGNERLVSAQDHSERRRRRAGTAARAHALAKVPKLKVLVIPPPILILLPHFEPNVNGTSSKRQL